jgi:hypothetical protein
MSMAEVSSSGSKETVPIPGTLAHIEYLAKLKIDHNSPLWEPDTYLTETRAAASFASIIRMHSNSWPLDKVRGPVNVSMTLDTSKDQIKYQWRHLFKGQLDLSPVIKIPSLDDFEDPELAHYKIQKGELSLSPHDWPSSMSVIESSKNHLFIDGFNRREGYRTEYSLYFPLNSELEYDESRAVFAQYLPYDVAKPMIYEQMAALDMSTERNPIVFHDAVHEAAQGLASFLDFS